MSSSNYCMRSALFPIFDPTFGSFYAITPKSNSCSVAKPPLASMGDITSNAAMPSSGFATLLALAALTFNAQARLFETIEECNARYGAGKDLQLELGDGFKNEEGKNWTAKIYSARGLAIQIIFENNAAVLLRYSNEPPLKVANSISRQVNLTVEENTHLRNVNLKEGITWTSHKDDSLEFLTQSMTFWISSDKQRYAAYDRENRQLFVCSDRFWNIVADNLRKQTESSPAIRFEGL